MRQDCNLLKIKNQQFSDLLNILQNPYQKFFYLQLLLYIAYLKENYMDSFYHYANLLLTDLIFLYSQEVLYDVYLIQFLVRIIHSIRSVHHLNLYTHHHKKGKIDKYISTLQELELYQFHQLYTL